MQSISLKLLQLAREWRESSVNEFMELVTATRMEEVSLFMFYSNEIHCAIKNYLNLFSPTSSAIIHAFGC